ncbi:major capsid family protein [Dyadobacter psychrotolerans]|uniref:DUF2184 domain-containing protein n=1 Tax=Dyadobacter psychrotolerans TaxID=2541721 RepID=A0A4V6PFV7_9BACT|nr:major capsid family protein [Dyadobacter psychrotolerans]TDE17708.1 DUF2184 domain-containing protein [Dyadobacter psychrotolerans]
MKQTILDANGKPIQLTPGQQAYANNMQRKLEAELGTGTELQNALGGDISFTTLTQVQSRIIQQKFYTFAPADYVPIRVGSGDYATNLLTYKEYAIAGGFETGLINDGSSMARLADVDAGIDSQLVPVVGWAKTITYSLPQLAFASRLSQGNWDLVEAKERARKRDWDLGIQRVAFLGLPSNPGINGLLTMPNITANTSAMTIRLSSMTAAQLAALPGTLLSAYQTQSNYTAYPDRFVIPQSDFNGLAAPTNPDFPMVTRLTQLETAFRAVTMNPNFKILPSPYGDQALNGLGKNRYILYRYDMDTLRMDVPVDYTPTALGSINGFQFQNVAHARFTGVNAFREREILYFDFT